MSAEARYISQADLEAACARLACMNAPQLPLARAAADGRIALTWTTNPDEVCPAEAVMSVHRPTVILVGDDPYPDGHALGPKRWAIARQLRTWAAAVIVHGAAGEPAHYREAVVAAEMVGRCVMIETASTQAQAWAEWFRCRRTLLILPRDGAHPVTTQETRH